MKRVYVCFFACLLITASMAQGLENRIQNLRQRYPSGTIILGPAALNDIRSILREPIRRKRIDSEADPIPLGARTLHGYTDSIFRTSLDANQAVLVLMIDFTNSKAFEKRASDTSGGSAGLPWLPQEVRAAAILSDELIRANAAYNTVIDSLRQDLSKPVASWNVIKSNRDETLVTDEAVSTFARLLVAKIKRDPKDLEGAKIRDPEAYRQVTALVVNQDAIDIAAVNFAQSPQFKDCRYPALPYVVENRSVQCVAFQKAYQKMFTESVEASRHFVILSEEEASKSFWGNFAKEVDALAPTRR
jgi:hypothetical protein